MQGNPHSLGYLTGWPAIARAIGPDVKPRQAKYLGERGVIRTFSLGVRSPSTTIERLREDLERAASGLPPLADPVAPESPPPPPPGMRRCVECGELFAKPRLGAPPRRCPKCRPPADHNGKPPPDPRGWKLTPEQRAEVRGSSAPTRVLAARFGVSKQAIRQLRSGHRREPPT